MLFRSHASARGPIIGQVYDDGKGWGGRSGWIFKSMRRVGRTIVVVVPGIGSVVVAPCLASSAATRVAGVGLGGTVVVLAPCLRWIAALVPVVSITDISARVRAVTISISVAIAILVLVLVAGVVGGVTAQC